VTDADLAVEAAVVEPVDVFEDANSTTVGANVVRSVCRCLTGVGETHTSMNLAVLAARKTYRRPATLR
jgi:hypothetical protein